ncbi:MAG: SH3 domain-containing protein [Aggregatilineales bacterium]
MLAAQPHPPTGVCVASSAGVANIRSGPGTNFAIVGTLNPGQTISLTGTTVLGWYRVERPGLVGFMSASVINLSGNCANLPLVGDQPLITLTPTSTPTSTVLAPVETLEVTPPIAILTNTPTPTSTPPEPVVTEAITLPIITFTPTATATGQQVGPTATPTTTLTPTLVLPTFTATPPIPIAPPDANFNSPLNIPLDSTASSSDFVSYPEGDREDRGNYDITGMNQNPSLSGGRARLIITASCFGTGTQHIQFSTGGQTFSCGQTIVDREVTYDSRTGSIVITAISSQPGGSTYVQWVLTGSATRVN